MLCLELNGCLVCVLEVVLGMVCIEEFLFVCFGGDCEWVDVVYVGVVELFVVEDVVDIIVWVVIWLVYVNIDFVVIKLFV